MIGLEFAVGPLITVLISSFKGLIKKFKKSRKGLANRHKVNIFILGQSFHLGALRVQEEYDRNFARLGRRFERGDGITINQLLDIIGELRNGRNENHNTLLDISERSRNRALSILADQYQRMSIAVPLTRTMRIDRMLQGPFQRRREERRYIEVHTYEVTRERSSSRDSRQDRARRQMTYEILC